MKAVVLLIIMAIYMYSIDFKEFKQKAIEVNYALKSAKLSIQASKKSSEILTQYKNPTVEGGVNIYENEQGWDLSLSQPIRVLGFGKDLQNLATSYTNEAEANFIQTKALFLKELESLYTNFVFESKLKSLLLQELKLNQDLENIAKDRLENGAGTKVQYLMTTLETQNIYNAILEQEANIQISYFDLLNFANIDEMLDIKKEFLYTNLPDHIVSKEVNPDILKETKRYQRLSNQVQVQDHNFKYIDIIGGYEQEIDQDIVRIGVGMDIPIFSRSSKNAQLAKINASKSALLLKELKLKNDLKIKALKNELQNLDQQYKALMKQQEKQFQLLKLYEEGYKISKGSLTELLTVKNRVIEQKRKALLVQKNINLKVIELNYLQGIYNENE